MLLFSELIVEQYDWDKPRRVSFNSGTKKDFIDFSPKKPVLDSYTMCKLFPYHVIFDNNLIIRQCGVKIQSMASINTEDDVRIDDIFNINKPQIEFEIDTIRHFINAAFILQVKGDKTFKSLTIFSHLLSNHHVTKYTMPPHALMTKDKLIHCVP